MRKISRQTIREIITETKVPVTSENKDEMSIPSYLHKNPLIPWLMWKRYEYILRLAQPLPGKKVLEFGCGLGLFLPTLITEGASLVLACDNVPVYAQKLTEKLSLPVTFVSDVESMKDNSVDIIIAADVMEHMEDPRIFTRLFKRKLTDSGKLILSGPTESRVYRFGRIAAGYAQKGNFHHTNINDLIKLISNEGFRRTGEKNLPLWIPPHLFKIVRFEK